MGTLRAEDSRGRTGEATFTVLFPGTSSQQALAVARRMHEQLEKAQVTCREQVLKIRPSLGLAALEVDSVASIEELMKLALQRLQDAASRKVQRAAEPAEASPLKPVSLPDDLDRAVQVLEHADVQRLGAAASGMLRRMLPFLLAVCRRLGVELPLDKITQALRNRPK